MSERLDEALNKRTSTAKLDVMAHALRTAENSATRLERQLRKVMEAEGLIGRGGVSGNRGGGLGGRQERDLSDRIGRLFGAHSRNNFLNIFGRTLGGMVGIMDKVTKGAGKMFGTFTTGFSSVASNASFLQKVMGGFAGMGSGGAGFMAGLAKSGPAAAAAIGIVVVALAMMASVVGALLGLVTALAATIAGALVASLIGLAGIIGTVVIAGGLLTNAFMSMTDAQKELLDSAFRPLKEEMVGLGQIMLEDMVPAFDTWSMNLQKALMQAVPVAQVMGKAFAEAGNIITASLSGPGFQMFSQSLAVYLPSIVTRLATALGGFLNGLMGVFSALMPYINQFAGYLAQVGERFSNWATSAQGQNAITTFVDRAVLSLKSLWGFVRDFGEFIGKLLFSPEAMTAGNTVFDAMSRKFQSFTDAITRAQADGSLQRWFNDAIQFGSQLWAVIEAIGNAFISLYNSGVIKGVGDGLGHLATIINIITQLLGPLVSVIGWALPKALSIAMGPLQVLSAAFGVVGDSAERTAQRVGAAAFSIGNSLLAASGLGSQSFQMPEMPKFTMPKLQSLGLDALNATSIDRGGYKPKKQWRNPWKKWANSLIKQGPSVSSQIKNAMLTLNKAAAKGAQDAARASGGSNVQDSLNTLMGNLTTGGAESVNTARSALNSAASSLANATSKKAAKVALAKVKAAQRDLKAALANQTRLNRAAQILNTQRVIKESNVQRMLAGLATTNVTLAEFAEARERLADMLSDANSKLQDAIAMRDDYRNQVAESIKSFGSLLSAQAQSIAGVEQALTATDITSNLQTRLDKIKAFQTNLKLLLAQGLSNDAYKQIVDAGVEQGSTFAEALLSGGNGSIQNVNSLVGQINSIADTLGDETSSRMYQAGVDAAQGLVDGLTSLSAHLDAAAYNLGVSIAAQIKRALGIASPSRVLRAMMGDVGDGAVLGLQDQHVKVGNASEALARFISINPGGGPPPAGGPGVSGNERGPMFRDLVVNTPTEDPMAVANEVLNEVVGRLP
jgi:hypothetical protein